MRNLLLPNTAFHDPNIIMTFYLLPVEFVLLGTFSHALQLCCAPTVEQ